MDSSGTGTGAYFWGGESLQMERMTVSKVLLAPEPFWEVKGHTINDFASIFPWTNFILLILLRVIFNDCSYRIFIVLNTESSGDTEILREKTLCKRKLYSVKCAYSVKTAAHTGSENNYLFFFPDLVAFFLFTFQ